MGDCEQGGSNGHRGKPQGQGQVAADGAAGQLVPPAPHSPQRQRPRGPGKPEQQAAQALPFLATVTWQHQAPAPQVKLPRQYGCERGGEQHGGRPDKPTSARNSIFMGLEHTQPCTTQTKQHGQSRCTTQHQARHAGHQSQPGAEPAVGRARNGVEHQRGTTQLCQVRRDFMRQLGQAQAGNQRQQAAIGHGACVIGGLGFATKGKCHGLCTWAARQVVHGVPGCHQGQGQQHRKGNTCCEFGGHPVRCDLQGCSTQPVGEQTLGFRGQAQQQRLAPGRMPSCQRQHVTKGRDVVVFPGGPADEPRHNIGNTQQQQGQPRQGAHGALGNDGGGRAVHADKDEGIQGCPEDTGQKPGTCVRGNEKVKKAAR